MVKFAFFEMSASDADYAWKRLDRAETFATSEPFEPDSFAQAGECSAMAVYEKRVR